MKLYFKWVDKNIENLNNKNFIVTGANVGIGFYLSLYLAYKKANVIMACRSLKKASIAKKKILEIIPNAKITIMELDLFSIESIDNFVNQYQYSFNLCHGLINNAGVYHLPKQINKDGFEIVMGTNYLGTYYLSNKIFPILNKTFDSRLIFTTSIAHRLSKINYDDFFSLNNYKPTFVYGRSKLAISKLFAYYSSIQSQVKIIATHPGISSTNLLNPDKGGFSKLFSNIGNFTLKIFTHSPAKACLSAHYAVGNKNVKNGDIYGPRGFFEISGYPKKRKLSKKAYQELDKHMEITKKFFEK